MNEKQPILKDFPAEHKLRLRRAILEADDEAENGILSEVAQVYGPEYANQWRKIVAEELGQQRIKQTSKDSLNGLLE